ncbi:MAG: amidohydrolase family protein [Acidobacteria bacterium]|nr:amidohydrolase family protein [Acidobacteriota bacterium]
MRVLLLVCVAGLLPAADLYVRNVTRIDVTGAKKPYRTSLWISGNRVRAEGARVQPPKDAVLVDGEGKYLLPGLWDSHFHLIRGESDPQPVLDKLLKHGVTTVRDMGSIPDRIVALRDAIAAGKAQGPRLIVAGAMLDGPPSKPDPTMHIVANAQEASAEAHRLAALKVDFLKVQQNLSAESYRAVAATAKAKGLAIMGHTPDALTVTEAAQAGQRSIEHLTGVLIACSSREAELRELIARGVAGVDFGPLGEAGRITLDSFSEQKALELFRQWKSSFQLPTLVWEKAYLLAPSSRRRPETAAMMKEYFAKGMAVVRLMHQAGIRFVAGTDGGDTFTTPGLGLHQELELLVEAGMTPLEALQSATVNAAAMMNQPLPPADFVLLSANPLDDIRNTRKVEGVITRGKFSALGYAQ